MDQQSEGLSKSMVALLAAAAIVAALALGLATSSWKLSLYAALAVMFAVIAARGVGQLIRR